MEHPRLGHINEIFQALGLKIIIRDHVPHGLDILTAHVKTNANAMFCKVLSLELCWCSHLMVFLEHTEGDQRIGETSSGQVQDRLQ